MNPGRWPISIYGIHVAVSVQHCTLHGVSILRFATSDKRPANELLIAPSKIAYQQNIACVGLKDDSVVNELRSLT